MGMKTKYITTVHECENCIVRVHRPILSAEERKSRENEVRKALVQFGRERMRACGELR